MSKKKKDDHLDVLTEVLLLTPDVAEKFLEKNYKNRTLDERLVFHYADKMESGLWVPTVAEVSFDEDGNLINGQHVCSACMLAQVAIIVRVTRNMPRESFAVYDTGKRRTGNQSLSMAGFHLGIEGDPFMKLYYLWKHYPGETPMEGFDIVLRGKGSMKKKGGRFSNELSLQMARELESELHVYFDKDRKKAMNQIKAGAVGLFSYWLFDQLKPRKSKEFFDRLLGYKGVENKCPTRALRSILTKNDNIRPYEKLWLFIVAWNAYCNGETRTNIQRPRRAKNVIVGTMPEPVGL